MAPDHFAQNIVDGLVDGGHVVTPLGAAGSCQSLRIGRRAATLMREVAPSLDEQAQRRIAQKALDASCEVVINIDQRMRPATVERMKRDGIRVAFWYPDAVTNMERQLMLLAPYDAIFFKEPHIVERLRANLDLPVHYLPEACNPHWHLPLSEAGTEPYLVIAGNMYASRVRLLDRLITKGIPLRLYGNGFPRWFGEAKSRHIHTGRTITCYEKAKIFRSAAGVLNTMHPGEVAGVNARLFEAAGSGAAVLTEFRPTIPELFAIDDELLVFRDFDELVAQAFRLINEGGITAKLGDAASLRAHKDHTYELRVAAILEKLS
jgi:spore maturation protein CgeB